VNFCGDYVNYKDASGKVVHNEDHWYNTTRRRATPTSPPTPSTASCPAFLQRDQPGGSPVERCAYQEHQDRRENRLQFKAESFNVSNTVIRPGPITNTFSSAGFGQLPKSQNNFRASYNWR
jgi:hypothetical protein